MRGWLRQSIWRRRSAWPHWRGDAGHRGGGGREHWDLASIIISGYVASPGDAEDKRWTIFDCPIDALWIEYMNTVLDDNMTLCLANGERIKLKTQMRMLFEVNDLDVASPATVSRLGAVTMTPGYLGWAPFVRSWMPRELPAARAARGRV